MLDVMTQNSEGLTSNKIFELVNNERASGHYTLMSALMALKKEGLVKNKGRHICPCCAMITSLYVLVK